MLEIIIRDRPTGYQAYVAGMTEVCGYGKSPDEAFGQMVRAHPEVFNVDVLE